MTLEFMAEAAIELHEAADFYESKQEGLGWTSFPDIALNNNNSNILQ